MKKRIIAFMTTLAMLLGCICDVSVVAAAEGDSEKYYLRSDYAVSIEGVTSDETKTDGSTGDPQIDVNTGVSAKIVVNADRLSEMSAATITYAQSGGTLDVKLTALTSADAADGVELCHNTLQAASGYATRTSDPMVFGAAVPSDAKFLRVELAVNGSLDGKSYVNYVEVSKTVKVKPIVQLKSAANGKVLDITGSSKDNEAAVTVSDASDAVSQTWELQEGTEAGWYHVINKNSDKAMCLLAGTTAPGTQPAQWTTGDSADQFWRFVEVKKDNKTYYKILNKNSKLVLTVADSKVTQETYTGADTQLFEVAVKQGNEDFVSKYDDNYSIGNISASAENYEISYSAMYSMQSGMYFEIVLSDGQRSTEGKGTFKVSADGEYTLTASVYEDNTKAVKVCEDYAKTITLANGEYKIVGAEWTSSTEQSPWTDNGAVDVRDVTDEQVEEIKNSAANYIVVDQNTRYQAMDSNPWGGCFNEKGWYAMRDLSDEERESVIQALFDPNTDGLKLTAGRTPIGSSDFGLDMYTYADDEWDDYDMSSFSIDRDKEYLIPYIKAAMKYVPDMPIFSSPWTPPAWMKTNNKLNGVESGWPGIEDTKENFEAYALYFVKYLEAYAEEGIDLHAVTPQNEPTMNTPYPSCVWNGDQLNVFLRDYLCDAVEAYNKANNKNVEVWLGTFTDSNQSMVWPTYKDPVTSAKVDGYCFQWWGAPLATKLYAQSKAENGTPVKMIQSESKCGGGDNSWQYAEEQFDCYKEFLDAGVSQYHLWNMILEGNGENNAEPASRRWPQNAPISVNGKNIHFNPSYYQVKHFSSNIDAGARRIKVEGNNLGEGSVSGYVQDLRAIGFQNTDGEVVLNVKNSTAAAKDVTVVVNNEAFDVTVPAHSINTFKLDGTYENTPDATEVTAVEETTNLKLTSAATGDLLSAEGYANGDVVNTASNRGESNQTWKLVKSDKDGYYHFVNFATDLGIAVWDGLTTEGAAIKQFANTGTDDQKWALEFVEYRGEGAARKAYYKITNYKSKLVLTALGESDNKALTQKAYAGTDDQLWTLDVVGGEWKFPDDEDPVDPTIPEVLADFNFDASGEFFDGGNAKATGTYTLEDHGTGKALKLNGTDQFLNVTAKDGGSLLTGVKEMTVSYQIKPENSKTNWGFFAAPNANKQEYQQEHYLGIADISGTTRAERYNGGVRPAVASTQTGYNGWYHVTVVYKEGNTALYINGEKAAEEASTYALTDILGESSILYIGKSTWVEGEYATALIDNYRIVSKALTDEEVKAEAAKYVEKDALKAAIDAKVDGKDTYTSATWKVYEDALAAANTVYSKADAIQEEVDSAAATLKSATSKLVKRGDKTALQEAIKNAVPADDKEKYTESSWEAYEKALAAAKEVEENADATERDVTNAVRALENAQKNLKEKDPEPPILDRPFVDVDKETGNWYYDAVYYNYDKKIMNGVNSTHFEPLSNLARAQFAIILHNMEGKPDVTYEPKFADVADEQWYTDAILWASSKGIVTGYTDGSNNFGWGDNILREQMAVMMYRYAKNFKEYDVSDSADFDKFTDAAQVNDYAKEAMKWAVGTGIITGKDNGTRLDPQGNASRAECAIIIQRFLEKYGE